MKNDHCDYECCFKKKRQASKNGRALRNFSALKHEREKKVHSTFPVTMFCSKRSIVFIFLPKGFIIPFSPLK